MDGSTSGIPLIEEVRQGLSAGKVFLGTCCGTHVLSVVCQTIDWHHMHWLLQSMGGAVTQAVSHIFASSQPRPIAVALGVGGGCWLLVSEVGFLLMSKGHTHTSVCCRWWCVCVECPGLVWYCFSAVSMSRG
jgi:hypothetical protein